MFIYSINKLEATLLSSGLSVDTTRRASIYMTPFKAILPIIIGYIPNSYLKTLSKIAMVMSIASSSVCIYDASGFNKTLPYKTIFTMGYYEKENPANLGHHKSI